MQDIVVTVLTNYGPFAAISIYFIWQTRKDYAGVCKRLNAVEDWQKTCLCDILLQNTRALERNNEVIHRNNEAIAKCMGRVPTQTEMQNADVRVQATKWTGDRASNDNR